MCCTLKKLIFPFNCTFVWTNMDKRGKICRLTFFICLILFDKYLCQSLTCSLILLDENSTRVYLTIKTKNVIKPTFWMTFFSRFSKRFQQVFVIMITLKSFYSFYCEFDKMHWKYSESQEGNYDKPSAFSTNIFKESVFL